jgi:ElaB/YqjD/DUF883 family membrane-anchored ribosome-binding protein
MNEEHRPEDQAHGEGNGRRSPEQIEAEIERTRTRISHELGAIGGKFTPEHIKNEARRRATEVAHRAGRRARRAGASFGDTARHSPLPMAMIGLGVGWLLVNAWRRAGQDTYDYDEYERYAYDEPYGYATGEARSQFGYDEHEQRGVRGAGATASRVAQRVGEASSQMAHRVGEKSSEVAHRVGEAGSHAWERTREAGQRVGQQARHRAQQARSQFDETLHDNPLAVGAVAVGLGAAVGLLLPSSRAEDRWLGERRDRLLEQARSKAGEVGETAREVMHEARDTAEREAEKRGLLPGQAAAGARDIASESVAAAREAFSKSNRPS